MPATSDRTTDLLDATCRVVAKSGAHGLRMSHVAREAGVSNALLHYYFETRAELLSRAFAYAEGRVYEHAGTELERPPEREPSGYGGSCISMSRTTWSSRRTGCSGTRCGRARSSIRTCGRRSRRPTAGGSRSSSISSSKGREDGSIPAGVDPEEAGARLAAVVDGIGSQLLLGLLPRERAAALIEQSIELELSGRTRLGRA